MSACYSYTIHTYFTIVSPMKKLIIIANPSQKSFTHALAGKLSELSKNQGDTVEILDLYTTELHQDFLRYEDKKAI